MINKEATKIFYCYADEDRQLCDKIEKQLSFLKRSGSIITWRDCQPGEEWRKIAEEQLHAADIILLLVSPDFMDSDYCYALTRLALKRDEEQTARVLPIILRPVWWQSSPLGKLQALPNNGTPITIHPDLDTAIYEVATGINKVIEQLRNAKMPLMPSISEPDIPLSPPFPLKLSRRSIIIALLASSVTCVGGGIVLWENKMTTSQPLFYTNHSDGVSSVSWSHDGMFIASSSIDKTVQIWNSHTGENIYTFRGHTDKVWSAAWSPDGKRLASAGDDDLVKIWDAFTGAPIFTYNGHKSGVISYGGVLCVAWSSDGKRLVSGSADYQDNLQVWDAINGENEVFGGHPLIYQGFTHNGLSYKVLSVSWSPADKTHIASASEDRTVQVWNATTGGTSFVYTNHSNTVMSAAWSPNGIRIASASLDKTVQIWDAFTGENILMYNGHKDGATSITWSPDGTRIASASRDKTVQIWNSLTGKHIFTYTGHTDTVTSVAWSPDGTHIASASQDKTVQIWEVP